MTLLSIIGSTHRRVLPTPCRIAPILFERTFLTENLTQLAAEVVRRLAGQTTETSAVFNMTTQFGGGKTHALTEPHPSVDHRATPALKTPRQHLEWCHKTAHRAASTG